MSGAITLGRKIAFIMGIGRQMMWHALDDGDRRCFETRHFSGVVCQQAYAGLAEQRQHSRRHAKVAGIDSKAKAQIGVHRVKALILKLIGAQLVDQANPAALLAEVKQDAPAALRNLMQCGLKLRPAVTLEAAQHITGEAFAMEADQRGRAIGRADDERDMLFDGLRAAEGDDLGGLRGCHGQEGAGDDGEAFGIVISGNGFGGAGGVNFTIFTHVESGEDAGQAGEFERGFCFQLLFVFNELKWSLKGVGKVGGGVRQRTGGGEGEPRGACDDDGSGTVASGALVGEFECCRARSGEQNVRRPIGIESRKPRLVRRFDSEQMQRPDRDGPAAAQCVYGAGS